MNKQTETGYLENIEECVFDENRIVTYKWLSKYLGLHVNISKQLLHTYAKNCLKRNEISLTYLVAGFRKNDEGVGMYVVREEDVERAKDNLQRITSEHVYSIQKVASLQDLNELYTAEQDKILENEDNTKFSSIEFNCIKRDNSFFEKLKAKTEKTAVKTEPQATTSGNPKASHGEEKRNKDSEAAVVNGAKVSEENTTDTDGSKKVVVPSMFAKAATTGKKFTTTAKVNTNQSKTSKQTGMAAFLSRAPPAAKPKEETIVQANNKHEEIKETKYENNDKDVHRHDKNKINGTSRKMEAEVIENAKENSVKNGNSKSTSGGKGKKKETKKGNKRHKESNNEDSRVKKRRRIIVMDSDSDSSSEESAHSEREPTPPPKPSTLPADDSDDDDDVITATPEPKAKRQRRRYVNKSYVDSDGYVVTKKEYIFEDCSDNENGESEKQTETKGEPKGTKETESQVQKELSKEEDCESQKEVSDSPCKNKNNVGSKKKPATTKNTKNSKKQSPPKAASPKKNKQQSITNFFTKKS